MDQRYLGDEIIRLGEGWGTASNLCELYVAISFYSLCPYYSVCLIALQSHTMERVRARVSDTLGVNPRSTPTCYVTLGKLPNSSGLLVSSLIKWGQ